MRHLRLTCNIALAGLAFMNPAIFLRGAVLLASVGPSMALATVPSEFLLSRRRMNRVDSEFIALVCMLATLGLAVAVGSVPLSSLAAIASVLAPAVVGFLWRTSSPYHAERGLQFVERWLSWVPWLVLPAEEARWLVRDIRLWHERPRWSFGRTIRCLIRVRQSRLGVRSRTHRRTPGRRSAASRGSRDGGADGDGGGDPPSLNPLVLPITLRPVLPPLKEELGRSYFLPFASVRHGSRP